MVDRWFDLRHWGASLERFKGENGVYLKLNLSDTKGLDEQAVAEAIVAAGWEADPKLPMSFINRSRIGSFREIKVAILPFFKDADINLENISKLNVNVYTGAFVRGDLASPERIEANLIFDGHRRDIIMSRVKAAAALAGIAPTQRLPFNGLMTRSMNSKFKLFNEPRDAAYLFSRVCSDFAKGKIADSLKLEKAIESACEKTGSKSVSNSIDLQNVIAELGDVSGTELADLMDDYKHKRETVLDFTYSLAKVAISLINPELLDPKRPTEALGKARRKLNSQLAYDMFMQLGTGVPTPCTIFDQDILSKEDFERKKLSAPPIIIAGFPVRYEPSLSTELKWQSHERISGAISTCSEIFSNDGQPLFGNQQTLFQVSRNGLQEGVGGKFRSLQAKSLKQGQVMYSPYSPYALIHEIGHAVDYGHSYLPGRHAAEQKEFDTKKIKRLLQDTGILDAVNKIADPTNFGSAIDLFSRGLDYLRYLTNPREIFARAFEEAVVNRVEASGDTELQSLGGGFIRRANYMIKDPDVLEHFIAEVRSFNREFMRENKLAEQSVKEVLQDASLSQRSM